MEEEKGEFAAALTEEVAEDSIIAGHPRLEAAELEAEGGMALAPSSKVVFDVWRRSSMGLRVTLRSEVPLLEDFVETPLLDDFIESPSSFPMIVVEETKAEFRGTEAALRIGGDAEPEFRKATSASMKARSSPIWPSVETALGKLSERCRRALTGDPASVVEAAE